MVQVYLPSVQHCCCHDPFGDPTEGSNGSFLSAEERDGGRLAVEAPAGLGGEQDQWRSDPSLGGPSEERQSDEREEKEG